MELSLVNSPWISPRKCHKYTHVFYESSLIETGAAKANIVKKTKEPYYSIAKNPAKCIFMNFTFLKYTIFM